MTIKKHLLIMGLRLIKTYPLSLCGLSAQQRTMGQDIVTAIDVIQSQ